MSAATRRDTLASLAGFLAGPALPATALASNPDAALVALGARWMALRQAETEMAERADRCHAATRFPGMPEALKHRSSDDALDLGRLVTWGEDDRPWYYVGRVGDHGVRKALQKLQTRPVRQPFPKGHRLHGTHNWIESREPCPERQARADEIVAAYDAWIAAQEAAERASGYRAASVECDRLLREIHEVEAEIEASKAQTLAGLAVSARIIAGDLAEDNDPRGPMLAGLVRDLLALAGPAAA